MTELAFGLLGYCHRQSLLLKYFYIQMAYFQEKQDVLCSNIHKTMLERITPGTTKANSQLPQEWKLIHHQYTSSCYMKQSIGADE